MRRKAGIALRFLLFHGLSVLLTAIFSVRAVKTGDLRHIPALEALKYTIHITTDLFSLGVKLGLIFALPLLVPSVLGWWGAGRLLSILAATVRIRPAIQGAVAGLTAHAAFTIMIGSFVTPALLGIPIGAVLGWGIWRIWPAPAPRLAP